MRKEDQSGACRAASERPTDTRTIRGCEPPGGCLEQTDRISSAVSSSTNTRGVLLVCGPSGAGAWRELRLTMVRHVTVPVSADAFLRNLALRQQGNVVCVGLGTYGCHRQSSVCDIGWKTRRGMGTVEDARKLWRRVCGDARSASDTSGRVRGGPWGSRTLQDSVVVNRRWCSRTRHVPEGSLSETATGWHCLREWSVFSRRFEMSREERCTS